MVFLHDTVRKLKVGCKMIVVSKNATEQQQPRVPPTQTAWPYLMLGRVVA